MTGFFLYPTKIADYRPSLLRSSGGRGRLRVKRIFSSLKLEKIRFTLETPPVFAAQRF